MAFNQKFSDDLRESRYLIDGYNLIFQCGLEGRSRDSLSLDRARAKLIATIATRFSPSELARVTIVFDARSLPIKEDESVSRKSGILVVFAIDHDDADTLIEELIRKNSNPKTLTVVSSDHRLHKAALRRKSTPVDSDIWFDEVEESPRISEVAETEAGPTDELEKKLPSSLQDVNWVEEFGFTDDEMS